MPRPKKKFFDYKKNRDWAENLQIVMQIGLTMAGCIVFCFFIGRLIDNRLGTKGIFTSIFTVLGVVGGGVVVYRQIMEITETKSKDETKGNNGSA
jgi:F0F1-type ATP synthase assembly protein I